MVFVTASTSTIFQGHDSKIYSLSAVLLYILANTHTHSTPIRPMYIHTKTTCDVIITKSTCRMKHANSNRCSNESYITESSGFVYTISCCISSASLIQLEIRNLCQAIVSFFIHFIAFNKLFEFSL